MARRTDRTYWVEFWTADSRVHRAMLESGARVPPHCLEAVHSRLRAAQVISDCWRSLHQATLTGLAAWRHVHSNRFSVAKHAHAQPAGGVHFLSCLIERSRSWSPSFQPTVGWFMNGWAQCTINIIPLFILNLGSRWCRTGLCGLFAGAALSPNMLARDRAALPAFLGGAFFLIGLAVLPPPP